MNIKLRLFRESKGVTQLELANAIGKSFRTVQSWERDESYPNAEMIWRMCEYFGTDPNTFMGWYDEHPRKSTDLTKSEAIVISDYRESTPEGRRDIEKYASDKRKLAAISRQDGESYEEVAV